MKTSTIQLGRRFHGLVILVVLLLGVRISEPVRAAAPVAPASLAPQSPVAPEIAHTTFQLEPGLRAELVAAEPLTASPVALAFDERSRLFVAENRGYPTGPGEGQPPAGVIALLEDGDGDGRMKKRTVFADGLTFPNGLMPWRGGLIVTCAPDVLWLRDTDGDGRADERRVLLTGFSTKGSTQLRVSHPTLGPDGWIYLTSGLTGGKITNPHRPAQPAVETGRTDVRFRFDPAEAAPTVAAVEPADGGSQFGMTFDDFGNRFICYNRVQAQHVVLAARYLKRNPNLAFSETVQNLPEEMLPEPLKGHGSAARVFPITEQITTADSHAGTFTAACAVHVYRGDALPESYRGAIFSCEPTGNLVHYDLLMPRGASFVARRAKPGVEFLASRDPWFRPVFLATGPDGALYICDMYRKTIEHPEYLPEEVRQRTDFESGKGFGRIWRVVGASGGSSKSKIQNSKLASADARMLVEALGHPNGWVRDTAFRLLVESRATNAVPALFQVLPVIERAAAFGRLGQRRAASDPTEPGPHLARVNALHTLFALSGGQTFDSMDKRVAQEYAAQMLRSLSVSDGEILQFLTRLYFATLDESPAVRAAAFDWLAAMPGEGLDVAGEIHRAWADDPNPHVRFRAALFLSKCESGDTFRALARMARRDGADRWLRAAVLSGLNGRENYFFETLWRETNAVPAPELLRELFRLNVHPNEALVALTDPDECQRLFGTRPMRGEDDAGWQIAGLAGLVEGLRARRTAHVPKLADFADKTFGDADAGWKADGRHLQALLDRAMAFVKDAGQPVAVRQACVTLLAHERGSEAAPVLLDLLALGQPSELQIAAAQAMAALPGDVAPRALLAPRAWRSFSPPARSVVIGVLLSQPRFLFPLLQTIESGQVSPNALDAAARNQLLKHKDAAIRERAEKLFEYAGGEDRMKVFEDWKSVLALKPDAAHGREVFARACANCHRLDRVGFAVGPDLFGMRNQPKEVILLHIIVPEREIMPGFANYTVEMKDGRSLSGLIGSQSDASVTLRRALGEEETLLRRDIATMTASGLSMMPQEIEKTTSHQEMADLLAYLKGEATGVAARAAQ